VGALRRLALLAVSVSACGVAEIAGRSGDASAPSGDATFPVEPLDANSFFIEPPDASDDALEASPPCAAADGGPLFFRIQGDGPDQTWNVECGSPAYSVPVAFRAFQGEGDSVGSEFVAACASLEASAPGILVSAYGRGAGTTDAGILTYHDGQGRGWTGQGVVTLDEWGPVGTVVEGTYAGRVTLLAQPDAGLPLTLSGSFRVCHAYDGQVAP